MKKIPKKAVAVIDRTALMLDEAEEVLQGLHERAQGYWDARSYAWQEANEPYEDFVARFEHALDTVDAMRDALNSLDHYEGGR